jgi:inosose dehydratase
MQGDRWTGGVEDILNAARVAGLDGVELTTAVLARWPGSAAALNEAVGARGLRLACLRYSMATGFTEPSDEPDELAGFDRAVATALAAGTRQLGLKGAAHPEPHRNREAKVEHAARRYNEIARRAADAGLGVNVHLHSHPDAVIRTPEEWDRFLDRTDPATVFVCADTGHLLRSGHDPAVTIRRHLGRIGHVHLKDATADGRFPPLGAGDVDVAEVLDVLIAGRYQGWIVLEEEDPSQIADPVSALRTAASLVREGAGG